MCSFLHIRHLYLLSYLLGYLYEDVIQNRRVVGIPKHLLKHYFAYEGSVEKGNHIDYNSLSSHIFKLRKSKDLPSHELH